MIDLYPHISLPFFPPKFHLEQPKKDWITSIAELENKK